MLLIVVLAGCSSKGGTSKAPFEKAQKMLHDMKTYKCTAIITFISNKNNSVFKVMQHGKMPDKYRMIVLEPEKLKNTVTMSDGDKIIQMDTRVNGKVIVAKPNKARNSVLINSFVKNYFQGEDSAVNASNMNGGDFVVLEATIPGDDQVPVKTQKLWIDSKTIKPVMMKVYDKEDNERITIKYEEFEYNCEIDDNLFKIGD